MASIKTVVDKDSNQFLPITHERAVRDDNGTTLETKLQALEGASLVEKSASTGTTGDYPYNGLGRVVLQKNMVSGVNTLTQAMMSAANTVYVIQYDYVLGADITIPANCVLEFDGGSISASGNNDTITGQNTILDYNAPFINGVTLDGSFKSLKTPKDMEIFKDTSYDTRRITSMFCIYSPDNSIVFEKNTYTDIEVIAFDRSVNVDFNGSTINMKIEEGGLPSAFLNMTPLSSSSNHVTDFVHIKNVTIIGNTNSTSTNPVGTGYDRRAIQLFKVKDVVLENVKLHNYYRGTVREHELPTNLKERYELSLISIMYYITAKIIGFESVNSEADNIIMLIPEVNPNNYAVVSNCYCDAITSLLCIIDGRCDIHHNIIENCISSALNALCYDSSIHHNVFKDLTNDAIDLSETRYYPENVEIYGNLITESSGFEGTSDFLVTIVGNISVYDNYLNINGFGIKLFQKFSTQQGSIDYNENCPYNREETETIIIKDNEIYANPGITIAAQTLPSDCSLKETSVKILNNKIICPVNDTNTRFLTPIWIDYIQNIDIIGNTISGFAITQLDEAFRSAILIGSSNATNGVFINGVLNINDNICLSEDTATPPAEYRVKAFVFINQVKHDTLQVNVTGNVVKNSLPSGVFSFNDYVNLYAGENHGIPNFNDKTATARDMLGFYENKINYRLEKGDMTFKNTLPVWWNGTAWVDATGTPV